MSIPYISNIVSANKINIHYIEYKNNHPKIILLHGLTANCFAFNGLIEAGLTQDWHVISMDQRGRGQSSKPAFSYSIREHAKDVIGLLDELKIDKITICGHSFGGLVASFLAYYYPDRFNKVIILDAAPRMNPNAAQMLMPAIGRIDKRFKNFDDYLQTIKKAEYMHFWDDAMLPYYKADIKQAKDGSVECISNISDIIQISTNVSLEPWKLYFENFKQPALLIVGIDDYTMGEPLMPDFLAKETVDRMKNCKYVEVEGNHQTMLFGYGAQQIVAVMREL